MELLQFLRSCDPNDQSFHIRDKVVSITIDDIYFLTGLSRRGAPISLSGFAKGGESMRDYIRQFCQSGAHSSRDGKINIRNVSDLPLRKILFTISKLVGRATLHLVNRSYMPYALECLEAKVFNWCEEVFSSLKEQLTKVKRRRTKNFGYGLILISFSLERIHLMHPQHVSLGVSGPRDPWM